MEQMLRTTNYLFWDTDQACWRGDLHASELDYPLLGSMLVSLTMVHKDDNLLLQMSVFDYEDIERRIELSKPKAGVYTKTCDLDGCNCFKVYSVFYESAKVQEASGSWMVMTPDHWRFLQQLPTGVYLNPESVKDYWEWHEILTTPRQDRWGHQPKHRYLGGENSLELRLTSWWMAMKTELDYRTQQIKLDIGER